MASGGAEDRESNGASDRSSDRASTHGEETVSGRPCPLCGASMYRRHCKYVCPNHGVVYDCGDTFW